MRMSGVVEGGGVLRTQDDGMIGGTLDRPLEVRGQKNLGGDGVIVEEAISGFGVRPGAASLRDGSGGLQSEVGGQRDQASDQALIGQRGVSEFMSGPIVGNGFGGCVACQHPAINYIRL